MRRRWPAGVRPAALPARRWKRVPLCVRPDELDGDDLRREPIERRKVLLIRLLAKAPVVGLQVNDHIVEPGDVVFRHACQLGFEGIVSKRLGSPYVSGRSRHWIKNKNPQHPAVKREVEEDWGR